MTKVVKVRECTFTNNNTLKNQFYVCSCLKAKFYPIFKACDSCHVGNNLVQFINENFDPMRQE
jgi:hypothetical protein